MYNILSIAYDFHSSYLSTGAAASLSDIVLSSV